MNRVAAFRAGRRRRVAAGAVAAPARPRSPYTKLVTLVVWALLLYLAIPSNIMVPRAFRLPDMSPNALSRVIKLAFLFASVMMMFGSMGMTRLVIRRLNPFFLLFLVAVPLSTIWSIWPAATSARFVSILCVVAVCLGFCVVGWSDRRFQEVVRPLATALLLASVVFGLIYPDLAIEIGEGTLKDAWHGLTAQKNQFGQLSSFAVIFWVHGLLSRQVKMLTAIPGIVLAFTCLLLSRSSTSLIATIFVVLMMFLIMRSTPALRRHVPLVVVVFTLLLVTYALAMLKVVPGLEVILRPIAAFTGKDLTFSNRSEIWEIIRDQIATHPLLGSGYGAYWIGPVPWSPSFAFIGKMYFYPTESHNGYLEIVNDLGVLGLVCLLGYMAYFVRQSLQLMRFDRAQGTLFLCLFFQQAIINLSESVWLQINGAFVFVLMTLAVFAMSRSLIDARVQARYAMARPPRPEVSPATDAAAAEGPPEPPIPAYRPESVMKALGRDR